MADVQEVYAKIFRAMWRGKGITLSADEVAAFNQDDAAQTAAVGGDCDDGTPAWFTPTERRRWEREEARDHRVFKPRDKK